MTTVVPPLAPGGRSVRKGLVLAVLALGQLMVVLDGTIVNVALPAMAGAFQVHSTTELQWVVTGYVLTFGGFLLLGGKLGDRFGRRRVFVAGTTLFAIASLCGGLSQNVGMLVASRVAQGIGGALLAPTALAMITVVFAEGKERNKAFGVFSAISAAGAAVGLVLGGVLTEYVSWRGVLFVNVPISIIAIVGALVVVPESRDDRSAGFDVLGAVLVTGGLMALVFALVKGNDYGWGSGRTLGALAVAAVLLIATVLRQRSAASPLLPLRVFRSRSLTGADVGALLLNAGVFAFFFFVILWMQEVKHFSPLSSGLLFLPITVAIGVSSGIAAALLGRFSARLLLTVGPLFIAAGLLVLGFELDVGSSYLGTLLPALVLVGLGLGVAYVALTVAAVSDAPKQDAGLASALLNSAQQIGGALGLAALTAVSVGRTSTLTSAGQAQLPALVHGWNAAFLGAAGLVVLAVVVMNTLVRLSVGTSQKTENVPETALSGISD